MSVLTTLGVFNYGLVLLYGLFLSTFISGGWENTKQRTLVFAACPLFLMIQSVCWLALGADMARQLYPLITHLPLALILIFILKKKVDVALVSICTAYLCCQLPRWVDLVVTALTRSELIGEICYTLVIGPLFYLLYRFFVRPAYAAMMASPQSLLLFGSLPVAYYFFDYATVVYSDALYRGYGAGGDAEHHARGRIEAVADRGGRAAPGRGADRRLSARYAPPSQRHRRLPGGGKAAAGGGIYPQGALGY